MSPTPRAATVLVAVALAGLVLPAGWTIAALAIAAVTIAADALLARRPLDLDTAAPRVTARGVPARFAVSVRGSALDRVVVRQANAPDIVIEPPRAPSGIDGHVVAHRRGRHALPGAAARRAGPLGLGSWTTTATSGPEILAYPDVFTAQRLVTALRQGRFREAGRRTRGPLGLGTDFESIRDYLPDDDFRQINWPATQRTGRPMSNQYRVEQDRDVVCVLDAGRLMAAPVGTGTRLDAAVDAVAAVALVADAMGDRCGVTVFDSEIRRRIAARRSGGRAVVEAVLDAEPRLVDSDFDLAFRTVGGAKRSLVIVLTDLVDEAAARSLVAAVPVLARRHAVVVASVTDPDLQAAVSAPAGSALEVHAAAVAIDVLAARTRAVAALRRGGAEVVEASPALLGEACVAAYLRLKARARL